MRTKLAIRQTAVSALVFAGVLAALVSVDPRVRDRMTELLAPGDGVVPWTERATDLTHALMTAARYQSIENAPLLVFASIGAVLFLFMFRA